LINNQLQLESWQGLDNQASQQPSGEEH